MSSGSGYCSRISCLVFFLGSVNGLESTSFRGIVVWAHFVGLQKKALQEDFSIHRVVGGTGTCNYAVEPYRYGLVVGVRTPSGSDYHAGAMRASSGGECPLQ